MEINDTFRVVIDLNISEIQFLINSTISLISYFGHKFYSH